MSEYLLSSADRNFLRQLGLVFQEDAGPTWTKPNQKPLSNIDNNTFGDLIQIGTKKSKSNVAENAYDNLYKLTKKGFALDGVDAELALKRSLRNLGVEYLTPEESHRQYLITRPNGGMLACAVLEVADSLAVGRPAAQLRMTGQARDLFHVNFGKSNAFISIVQKHPGAKATKRSTLIQDKERSGGGHEKSDTDVPLESDENKIALKLSRLQVEMSEVRDAFEGVNDPSNMVQLELFIRLLEVILASLEQIKEGHRTVVDRRIVELAADEADRIRSWDQTIRTTERAFDLAERGTGLINRVVRLGSKIAHTLRIGDGPVLPPDIGA